MKLAAVDLGSNSFRLVIAAVEGDLVLPRDDLKAAVRLAAGLTPEKWLTPEAMARGWLALKQFAERLDGFHPDAVRAVGTNTLRVAKNAAQFLAEGQELLGFPIEVISGREEARLIYLGVVHTIPEPHLQNLVFDIGGGSTEFIIGKGAMPHLLESLYMGCVGYSNHYFPDGEVTPRRFAAAYTAARLELEAIAETYRAVGWEQVFVSSGSAKAIRDVVAALDPSSEEITAERLAAIERLVLSARSPAAIAKIPGMRPERCDIFAAGLAIMKAAFDALGIASARYAEGAMRLGVLYDLLGRSHHQDIRSASIARLMERCGVDPIHATRVERTAVHLAEQLQPAWRDPYHPQRQFLCWAAQLHEVGLFIAHSGYHKHGAYLVLNADLPGFSQADQALLARWVLGHRGKLSRLKEIVMQPSEWDAVLALRLAVLLNRARNQKPVPQLQLSHLGSGYQIGVPHRLDEDYPLTWALLQEEREQWQQVGKPWQIVTRQ
jgi:exopolyphosphatase/guanosine-5'-triphosphate,3'-diphosphate pyrophosphatase